MQKADEEHSKLVKAMEGRVKDLKEELKELLDRNKDLYVRPLSIIHDRSLSLPKPSAVRLTTLNLQEDLDDEMARNSSLTEAVQVHEILISELKVSLHTMRSF